MTDKVGEVLRASRSGAGGGWEEEGVMVDMGK